MPTSTRQRNRLYDQYPFLREISNLAGGVGEQFLGKENLTITVQRADPDFMFRQPRDVTGMGQHYLMDPKNEQLHGVRQEYCYPVNVGGQVGKRYPRSDRPTYVRDLFSRDIFDWADGAFADGAFSGENPATVIDKIVWVTRTTWFRQDADHEYMIGGDGTFDHLDIELTVYQEPEIGWERLFVTADPQVNVRLSGGSLLRSLGSEFDGFQTVIHDRLYRLARQFELDVYRDELNEIVARSTKKGMSGQFGEVKVSTYVIMGRILIQLERGGSLVTFQGLDEKHNPSLSFTNIDGTLPSAIAMTECAIAFWKDATSEVRRATHVDNENVGMGF